MTLAALADGFGRVATDLRVSLTDRCNLRCSYCMPAEGLDWLPDDEVLTDDEVVRLITIAVERLGVREVRFTGGEPLLRRGLVDIVAPYAGADARRPEISMTTNALGLTRTARRARRRRPRPGQRQPRHRPPRGLPRRSPAATGSHDVVAGLEAAAARPGSGRSRSTPCCCAASTTTRRPSCCAGASSAATSCGSSSRCRSTPSTAGAARRWSPPTRSSRRLEQRVRARRPAEEPRGSAPAELFLVDGGPATVGVIASVTRPFCGDCDRVRLTADGQVRNCLFAREESDLRARAARRRHRRGDRRPVAAAMSTKRPGHGIDDPTFLQPDRPMSAIGG